MARFGTVACNFFFLLHRAPQFDRARLKIPSQWAFCVASFPIHFHIKRIEYDIVLGAIYR